MISRAIMIIATLVSLILLGITPVGGAGFVDGVVNLSDRLSDGTSIKVKVQKINRPSGYPYKDALMWGSDLPSLPPTVITKMEVQIGKDKTFIPLSAYSDLGDPGHVLLEKADRGFKLVITGGDAAGSYKAVLVFDRENIKRRKVMHGEFPDEVWQETVYSFISKTDKR